RILNLKKSLWLMGFVSISCLALPTLHFLFGGGFVISRSPNVFMMAHLIDNGTMKKFLSENCDKPGLKSFNLCTYRDRLDYDLSSFLFHDDSPLYKTGGWETNEKKYGEIISAMLKTPG